ncbi:MAG: hypothetical protein ACXVH2_01275, partial [Methanobacterium sp.]
YPFISQHAMWVYWVFNYMFLSDDQYWITDNYKYHYRITNIQETFGGEKVQTKFDLQHFCCGPEGCQIEIEYGEMIGAE